MCWKESHQSCSWGHFLLLPWLLSAEWLCSIPNKQHNAAKPYWLRASLNVLCICTHWGSKSRGDRTRLNMVCTLCMTPILHLYDLIGGKLLIFSDVGSDCFFFWSKGVWIWSLCHTPHAPAQSSSWGLRRCVGCPGAMHGGEPHAVWMFPCQKACMYAKQGRPWLFYKECLCCLLYNKLC